MIRPFVLPALLAVFASGCAATVQDRAVAADRMAPVAVATAEVRDDAAALADYDQDFTAEEAVQLIVGW